MQLIEFKVQTMEHNLLRADKEAAMLANFHK
jgi:hypothetical protein